MKSFISAYLKDGELCRKDQILLLLGLFSARRDEEKLKLMAEIAVENNVPIEEQADIISSTIISRGIPSWLSGIEALEIAKKVEDENHMEIQSDILFEVSGEEDSEKESQSSDMFSSVEECIHYYKTEFVQVPPWVQYLMEYAPSKLLHYSNLRTASLNDNKVPRLLKELLLYAINVCDRYPKGIAIHKTNAIILGASQELLYEVRKLCVLAVGVGAMK